MRNKSHQKTTLSTGPDDMKSKTLGDRKFTSPTSLGEDRQIRTIYTESYIKRLIEKASAAVTEMITYMLDGKFLM